MRTIRKKDTDTKILILSARAKVDEKILGLDEGANDNLVKPFDFGELEARIRNLLRRDFSSIPATIMLSGFIIDTSVKKVVFNGEVLSLTRKEYGILEYLILNKNKVVSAEEFIEHIWDSYNDPFSNALRYHIHSLKRSFLIIASKK